MKETRFNKSRRGTSLLEMTVAVGLLALALVPGLRLMRDAMQWGGEINDREMIVTLCVSTLEENLATVANSWTEATSTGSFAGQGYADLRYSVSASEQTSDGGMPDQLMAVTVTVWHDANGNGSLDSEESFTTMASKVAKLATYTS
ncbi:MAG: hypothetical protein MI757_05550 [Pirellulales bacterium]|nr:hypothetical protein [Pirellulales bacterium]